MLNIEDIHTNYGHVKALRGVTLRVKKGEIVTLIGANGAGKTTLLKSIMSLVSPFKGQIKFLDEHIRGLATEKIVRKGVVLVPEGRSLLNRMTVLENLLMGAYISNNRSEIRKELERVFDQFPALMNRQKQKAGTLSGGEQQMLAIGRALMAKPLLLMLDEPSLGLAPIMVKEIFEIVTQLFQTGSTILLIEQNAKKALQVSSRAYVLELGEISMQGISSDLLENDRVRSAYLGGA